MKPSTRVSIHLESVGRPDFTREIHDESLRDVTIELAKWLLESYMGSHIRITIARDKSTLRLHTGRTKKSNDLLNPDMMDDLTSILDQGSLSLLDEDNPSD